MPLLRLAHYVLVCLRVSLFLPLGLTPPALKWATRNGKSRDWNQIWQLRARISKSRKVSMSGASGGFIG